MGVWSSKVIINPVNLDLLFLWEANDLTFTSTLLGQINPDAIIQQGYYMKRKLQTEITHENRLTYL